MKGKMKFGLGVSKRENAGYQHFLLFPPCSQKAFLAGSLKVGIVWKRVKRWFCGKAATALERRLCGSVVKETQRKHPSCFPP